MELHQDVHFFRTGTQITVSLVDDRIPNHVAVKSGSLQKSYSKFKVALLPQTIEIKILSVPSQQIVFYDLFAAHWRSLSNIFITLIDKHSK